MRARLTSSETVVASMTREGEQSRRCVMTVLIDAVIDIQYRVRTVFISHILSAVKSTYNRQMVSKSASSGGENDRKAGKETGVGEAGG